MCSGCGTWAAPAAWPVRCLRGAAGGMAREKEDRHRALKGKLGVRETRGGQLKVRRTSLQSKGTGRDRQRGGPERTGQAGVCCPGRGQVGTGARTRAGAPESPACQAGTRTAPRSAGACAYPAPRLCLAEGRRRGRSRFSAPTTPSHDPLPRPPAQPRLTPVLEPRAPERLGLPSVWAGPGLGSAAGARWAGNVGPACEELTIRCRGQNSHPREPRSSTEKALRGSPQSRETGHLRDQGCGRSPREKTGGAHDGLAVGCPAREAWEAVCLDAEPCWGRGCQGGCLACQAGCPRRRLTPRCGNLSSRAAALSAGGRGQMLSQALRRKSQAIFLLWLGVST